MAVGYTHSRKYTLTHQSPLRFGADGKFKILHLTDIHKICPEMDNETDRSIPENKSKNTLHNIHACIERTNPDLIVFGGDNVAGHWDEMTNEYFLRCIQMITAEIREKNIPLAIVFGNHDAQTESASSLLSREIQMSLYMNYDNFRGCFNEADVYGCGNYHIPILAHDSDAVLWNVWCMDSNDYPRNGDHSVKEDCYDSVHADQIAWYETTVRAETEKYGRTIPAVLFQHIPVRQEYDFIEECTEAQYDYELDGRYYRAKAGALQEGVLQENPGSPKADRSEFEAWARCGDIKAAFFGHDHMNSFRFDKDGIALYQTICCGYETYGGDQRGGRLITLDADGEHFDTELLVIEPKY